MMQSNHDMSQIGNTTHEEEYRGVAAGLMSHSTGEAIVGRLYPHY